MKTYSYVPVIYISALTKQRLPKIIEMAKKIKDSRQMRISTGKLNRTFLPELEKLRHHPIQGRI